MNRRDLALFFVAGNVMSDESIALQSETCYCLRCRHVCMAKGILENGKERDHEEEDKEVFGCFADSVYGIRGDSGQPVCGHGKGGGSGWD